MLVGGPSFYPAMLSIRGATSSVSINQFGFRPGHIGDTFAEALVAKAAEGVPVRLVVDRNGSDPEGSSRSSTSSPSPPRSRASTTRATKLRAADGPLGGGGVRRWNLSALGHIDHRKVAVVDGRIGWVGGAGIEDHFEDGRFHDLFVRVTGPVVAQLHGLHRELPLAWGELPAAALDALFPELEEGSTQSPRSCSTTPPDGIGRDHRCDRGAARGRGRDARCPIRT